MKVVVAGGTGFIGRALTAWLESEGHDVVVLTRRSRPARGRVRFEAWDGKSVGPWADLVAGSDGVVNLAGESVAGGRWTAARKEVLRESRFGPTRAIVEALSRPGAKAKTLINASAVGYYGDAPEGEVVESSPRGADFLADLCGEWEAEARKAEEAGVRVVSLRLGVVLGRSGGALAKMLPPFKLFFGGPLGSGRQWMPWVHVEDVVGAALFALGARDLRGPVNATAPDPRDNRSFSSALGRALGRPSWAPVPAFVLRLALGEMAGMLLTGQKAAPAKLLSAGYVFRFPRLEEALANILAPAGSARARPEA